MFGFEKARRPYFGGEWVAKKWVAKGGRNHTKKKKIWKKEPKPAVGQPRQKAGSL